MPTSHQYTKLIQLEKKIDILLQTMNIRVYSCAHCEYGIYGTTEELFKHLKEQRVEPTAQPEEEDD